jgi:HlyD family secretion protein
MKKRLPWILGLVIVLAGLFAFWRYSQAHRAPEVTFKTQAIEKRRISGKITATGTLQALVTVQVGSQVSGRISKLFADFNSKVEKGALVATIDPQLFQAAVEQAHANYVSADASVVKAKAQALDADRQYARAKALHAEGLASQTDLDTAETNAGVAKAQIDVAKAALEQARASLNQVQVNLSYTKIVSPIDGVVISRSVDVGQTVAASLQAPVLFTIAEDLRKMQVNTNVAEADVGRLQPDMPAFFTVDAFPGQRFRGRISQIRNAAQTLQNVVTYDAVIDVDNADLKLRPGMTANVTVTYAERDGVLRFRPPPEMPGAPPVQERKRGPGMASGGGSRARDGGAGAGDAPASDERTVWLQNGPGAEPATVHVGLSDGTYTEVLSGGVKEGDLVITDATVAGKSAATPSATSPSMRRMF